jgi:pimeloyl-ACP methyl ester carboxylesterase
MSRPTVLKTVLTADGFRTIVPYLRGFGPTRFLHNDTPRSGQQAALAYDLNGLIDSLKLSPSILVGYDWGARPRINVPTIVLHGAGDGVHAVGLSEGQEKLFSARYERRVIPTAGHLFPREAPDALIAAVRELASHTRA